MKTFWILLLNLTLLYSADTLIDALLQGSFEKKISLEPTEGEDTKAELNKQKVTFHYLSAPIQGVQFEVKNDGLIAYAKAIYRGNFEDFGYMLSANSYTTNTSSYTMDINYNLRRELAIGSYYTYTNETINNVSLTGIYSSFILDDIHKGFNVKLNYDKYDNVGTGKESDKFSIKIKNNF